VAEKTLTDYEISSLSSKFCLADGHAYHDPHPAFARIISGLPDLWEQTARKTIPEAEAHFRDTYASLIKSKALANHTRYKVCPTASNSIDIVGAALKAKGLSVGLVEPTFDNLALLLRRRGVRLHRNAELDLLQHIKGRSLGHYAGFSTTDVLFLVNPNNPTGTTFDSEDLSYICRECRRFNKVLVVDNCFRLFNRNPYDDYAIMKNEGVAFVSIEDTGKVWPTLDMKASLLVYSDDFSAEIEEIYNEIYLCASPFSLMVLASLNKAANAEGVEEVLWRQIDDHRSYLRNALKGSPLIADKRSENSTLSVEWLSCERSGLSDLEVRRELERYSVMVLPGRHFYWASTEHEENHRHIRVSLLKKTDAFRKSVDILARCSQTMSASRPAISIAELAHQ
jgi:aspartate/methionine/tyrosine aminotransferase